MQLYHFADPHDYRFARAGRRGTWASPLGFDLCPECRVSREERVSPLVIEWLPDSDTVGDFTWPGFNDEVVVTDRVRQVLEAEIKGCKFGPVEMYQDVKVKKPERITKRTKARVWLPYQGPQLWDLRPLAWCGLHQERSQVFLTKICSTCGQPLYKTPSYEERHLVVDPATWNGEDIFQVRGYGGWVFCTERVKIVVESHRFTNVRFLLDGEIPA